MNPTPELLQRCADLVAAALNEGETPERSLSFVGEGPVQACLNGCGSLLCIKRADGVGYERTLPVLRHWTPEQYRREITSLVAGLYGLPAPYVTHTHLDDCPPAGRA